METPSIFNYKAVRLFLVLVVLAVAGSIFFSVPHKALACTSDADCGSDQTCDLRDGICGSASRCDNGVIAMCPGGRRVGDLVPACVCGSGSDCGNGYTCVNAGQCGASCQPNGDGGGGGGCGSGQLMCNGVCTTVCGASNPCGDPGYTCVNGDTCNAQCLPPLSGGGYCGDNTCDGNIGEDCNSCSQDCGSCSNPTPAAISISPTTFNFAASVGAAAPASQVLTITNTGGSNLNPSVTVNQSWCHVNSAQSVSPGSIVPSGTSNIYVTVDAPSSGLIGTNNCTITVADGSASNSPQTAAVSYTVTAATTPTNPGGGGICNSQSNCSGGTTGNPPSGGGAYSGGGTPACSYIRLEWTDASTNETGFKIYRSAINNFGSATLVSPTITSTTGGQTGQIYGIDESMGANTTPYYYWVTAYNASGESGPLYLGLVGAVGCGSNLVTSNKEIIAINGNNVAGANTYLCQGQTNPLGSNLINNGDVLEFAINACNNSASSNSTATVSTIVDNLTNLVIPTKSPGDWSARYCQGSNCKSVTPSVSGSTPNQSLTFTINKDIPWGTTAAPGVLIFYAQVAGASSASNYNRFQNNAIINYNSTSQVVNTPLILFYSGNQSPTRTEVAP